MVLLLLPLGLLGLYRNNGKGSGRYYITLGYILGLYRDNGKENGNSADEDT